MPSVSAERVLVCILAKTRAHEVTFDSFRRNVLEELGADLALALTIDAGYDRANPYWRHAKYRWTAADPADYGELFDLAQAELCSERGIEPGDWRRLLARPGAWAGRIHSRDAHPTASAILVYSRWLLWRNLVRDGVLERYDRFVVTRSDFVWLCPHPPLAILDAARIWIPDGHHWSGINDRHLVVSRGDLEACLAGLEDVVLRTGELLAEMRRIRPEWNDEQFLAHSLRRRGVLSKVAVFPYAMYTARSRHDSTLTWSAGRYEPSVGHYVKYETEYRQALALARLVRSRDDWERGRWKALPPDAEGLGSPPTLLQRLDAFVEFLHRQWQRPDLLYRLGRAAATMWKRAEPDPQPAASAESYDALSRKRALE